jgi:urease subunit beta
MIPGEIIPSKSPEILIANEGLETIRVVVSNVGDRPIQVGSHFHFYEVNDSVSFDREMSKGLNIPAGTAVRFEPGDEKEVEIVSMAGERMVFGLNGKVNGSLDG